MLASGRKPVWVYLVVIAALIGSIWVGWGDFDPYVPRKVVQETIRAAPRNIVQILVQFVVPALLLGFLAKEALAVARPRRKP